MEKFKRELINLVNQAKLPPEAIFYVVKDFYRDIIDSYNAYLEQQAKQEQAVAAEQEKEEE